MNELQVTCRTCGAVWWMEFDPPACTCDDDGNWQVEEVHRG